MDEPYFAYRIMLVFLLLGLNAFFAAAEVALISCPRSRLRALAEEGQAGAHAALSLLANPERLLSVTQVGVTLASLGLGWAGEDTLFQLIVGLFQPVITPASAKALHALAFTLAFLGMSFAHVVVGEVVPKNLALERRDRLATTTAPALLVFYRVSEFFVFVVERAAVAVSRLLGLRGEQHGGGHSSEELKFIVSSSGRSGHLEPFEEDAIQRLLDLRNYSVREIMVPRNDMVSVSVDASLDHVLRVMAEHHYSRLPVYQGRPEQIIGILHYRDVLAEVARQRPFRLRRLLRKPLVAPESKPVNQLVDEFRSSHTHMAMVVDEFGTIVGLVTLEDALEQIFGEIEDEHDVKRLPAPAQARVLELDGATNIPDLDNQYGIELPGDAGFETLAGFLLFRLGHIPEPGESVEHEGRRFTIREMDRNRIAKVRVERLQ